MRSLRARLIAGLLALAAVGLLLLAGISYAEQRSFLNERLDQQTQAAPGAVARSFFDQSQGQRDPDVGSNQRGGPPPGTGAPAGTYGELRTSGQTYTTFIGLSTAAARTAPKPTLPKTIKLGRLFTVDGSDGEQFRVLAQRDFRTGAILVAAVPTRDVDQTLDRLLLVDGLAIVGVLLGLGLSGWVVVRIGLLPLDRMGHTAGRIAGGDLSHRVPDTDPRTEVGRLGNSLNSMLDRLEQAFTERQASEDRLRTFLADASHELRTPLASIRGYAELYRMGATVAPGETDRAMVRIEDEAKRMGVLVEDLLTLARLDEVADNPHTEVDLAALARDTVDDARAMAPERQITAHVADDAAIAVTGDGDQLRQVLANLVRNALVHTPADAAIEVGVERASGVAVMTVRDHGPGLPAEDPSALFERFWRAEGGRERGKDGAGLGLAIVAAIVDAHGGEVEAENAEGGGARFTVRLPERAGAPRPHTAAAPTA